ncbi:MAG: family transcriptional regulator, cyclic receptor protein [Candidatus Petromonas sp.]|jgi:CRP/FNR family transcriptional regulator|nr:family transcriptional regulator, cyclic receptor protein [Candidatus Petromonas sp.]
MRDSFEVLRRVPIFSQLKDEDLEKIMSITIEKKYNKGSIIFMEGDKGEAFYFIKSGKIKIYRSSKDGKELILNIYGKNNVFAEVTIFNDVSYPATAEVIEDAVVGMILNSDLEKLIKVNSELGLNLIKVLNKRLYNAQLKLKQIALNDTYSRTAQAIIRLAEEHGKNKSEGVELKLELSRQELANMIGTARETVSRILSQFKKEGAIEISRKRIVIKDIRKLKSWL